MGRIMTVREKVNKEITFGLLIRRSQVRILPGAPIDTIGYEISLIAHFGYVGTV